MVRIVAEGHVQGPCKAALRYEVERHNRPIVTHHLRHPVRPRLQTEQLSGEGVDAPERGGVEDALRVLFVHDPDDHEVVQTEGLLHLVMKDPHRLVFGEHVFRVIIESHLGKLRPQPHHKPHHNKQDHPRKPQTEIGQRQTLHNIAPLSRNPNT